MRKHPTTNISADVEAQQLVDEHGVERAYEMAKACRVSDFWHYWDQVVREVLLIALQLGWEFDKQTEKWITRG